MNRMAIKIKKHTPLLLRRAEKIPSLPRSQIRANMTVVTTPNNKPEMHDQQQDATAPRND
jgi:hypothetical protein